MISILMDTSYLITLADSTRPHHTVAVQYLRQALEKRCPLYLSAIVASEFQVGQPVTDLPLRNFHVLPFNIDHAMTTGQLMRLIQGQRDPSDNRAAVKDDVKLIAQMVCDSITHILTEDKNTLVKYLKLLNELGETTAKAILLEAGFDSTWFNGGQRTILET